MLSGIEGVAATLENVLDIGPDRLVVKRADAIDSKLTVLAITFERNDQLCVAQHRDVSGVSTNDYLTPALEVAQVSNNTVENEAVVQVVLGLVDHEWCVGSGQQQEQQRCCLLALGQLRHALEFPRSGSVADIELDFNSKGDADLLDLPEERFASGQQTNRLGTLYPVSGQGIFTFSRGFYEVTGLEVLYVNGGSNAVLLA